MRSRRIGSPEPPECREFEDVWFDEMPAAVSRSTTNLKGFTPAGAGGGQAVYLVEGEQLARGTKVAWQS